VRVLASLQAKHSRLRALGRSWTLFNQVTDGCTCPGGPTYSPSRERRDVDLISDVVALLRRWQEQRASSVSAEALVFPGESGTPFLSPSTLLRRELYPVMKRAGVSRRGPTHENRTFHSFRHTFAKRALESGAQIS
jgi:integrase